MDVSGTIEVVADNVTIQNTRVTLKSGSCGATNACGNYEIRIAEGVTGTVIKNSELRAAAGITCSDDVRNTSGGTVLLEGDYLHGCDGNLYSADRAAATIRDTYGIAKQDISNDHVENVYFDNSTLNVLHSTLLNPIGQTAVTFGNVNTGFGGICKNHLTVEDSLFAGGGYTIYQCAHGTAAGSSSLVVKNTHFARCTSAPIHESGTVCARRADEHGYFPESGYYGLMADFYGMTWRSNVWDDDLAAIHKP
jgi:hypothetical protein